MKILIVGAGAIGGYFGARLAAGGRDVTFLVRATRAAQLRRTGLQVKSPEGDLKLEPKLISAQELRSAFDLILLSCKAYDLGSCIDDITPAVGADSLILPLLNGMAHMDRLDERFGAARVLGGLARISSGLDAEGVIHHYQTYKTVVFGARSEDFPHTQSILETLSVPGFETLASRRILQDMWEKWIFIATAASTTTLMRANVGDIVAAGADFIPRGLFAEAAGIAADNGFAPSQASIDIGLSILTARGSTFTASMFRDIESHRRVEADHLVGDLLKRSAADRPLLKTAFAHLKSYETRLARETAKG
jgi:2-dehydropantoate 2-reductase